MDLYLLDYGAGNVQSLANSLQKLGYSFKWIDSPSDFDRASKLIFPGVGAFQTAIEHLTARGLLEPLRRYINSGKPYFGICIGLQVLFQSSSEAPSVHGLGIIPSCIERFDDATKAVPHMGWNSALFSESVTAETSYGMSEDAAYYFVHSYRARYDPAGDMAAWAHTVTQYGEELFVSTVRRGHLFATQFHPEKSGVAGMRVLDGWLQTPIDGAESDVQPRCVITRSPQAKDGFIRRVIACLDVRANDEGDLVVTKGDQYDVREKAAPASSASTLRTTTAGAVRNLGKPVALAERYYAAGADEICFLNITSFRSSPLHDQPMLAVVRAAAEQIFVPLTIGGGIKDSVDPDGTRRTAVDVASAYFRAGADKVSIGSEAVFAVERLLASGVPSGDSAIEAIAHAYGRQAVVVSADPRRAYVDAATYGGPQAEEVVRGEDGKAWWYQCTVSGGREARPVGVVQLARGVERLGAGEILLNSIDRDGTGAGFDLALIRLVKAAVRIPVVASSGAGCAEHFVQVFQGTRAEAALAAGIFHRGEVGIPDVKSKLIGRGLNARR
ncbi:imidazoleglycerol phosphate synthase [Gautieria morchelliformis]|nr:imidazoleglycerol phosphate synthase [Gautieria morchelliformis]